MSYPQPSVPAQATMVLRPAEPSTDINEAASIECGEEARKQFALAEGYRNLNHGSFGTYPTSIRRQMHHYQDWAEAKPDSFIRYEYPKLLDKSREAVAAYLNAPVEACVFVPNATSGVNTVLRGLEYQPGDVIIFFATIYGACHYTVTYVTETTHAECRKIEYTYPVSDAFLCTAFEQAVEDIKKQGKNPKVAIFDTIVSLPGVRMPFEELTKLCKKHDVLSCIDGAHAAGHIAMDLSNLDPDFFVTNCHKWMHSPRGCALFYVPERNQHFIRSTLPTSHGFIPRPVEGRGAPNNPLPLSKKSQFITNFQFVGTIDNTPYLCVPASIEWRKKLTWNGKKGEEAILEYTTHQAHLAGEKVAAILGTEVLENEERTLTKCNFANVRLPLSFAEAANGDSATANQIAQWIAKVLVEEHNTFIAIILHGGAWWVRLSAQVYLTIKDFEWAGKVLAEVCQRVEKGDWKS